MGTLLRLLLVSISTSCVLSQSYPSGTTPIALTDSAVSASYSLYESVIEQTCVNNLNTNYRSYPTGYSIENLIALIEKLESRLYNSTDTNLLNNILGAEKLARILLRRFRFDGFDGDSPPAYRKTRDQNIDQINTAFLGKPEQSTTYYFPDYVYTQDELCSLFYMLSHNIVNGTSTTRRSNAPQVFRGKRQAYNYNRRQFNNPTQAPYVVSDFVSNNNNPLTRNNLYPIKEEGVVSFRGNKNEAIAPARVLIGIIAGLSTSVKTTVRDVLAGFGFTSVDSNYDKPIDPVLAMTLGDLWGTGVSRPNDDKSLFYGISGEWSSTGCTTHYGLTSVTTDKFNSLATTSKGTKAEIRGGLDGYLIGKALNSIKSTVGDASKLRLSTILRSYYSKPRISKTNSLTASYCDRTSTMSNDLQNTASLYNYIQNSKVGGSPSASLLSEFTGALQSAQQIESNGFAGYCDRPSGTLDKNAPCETPSDVIFLIDGQTTDKLQISGDVVSSISGNLNNIRREGGTVSIFFNSFGQNSVNTNIQLPSGPGSWPLVAASFNSTNTGCSSCRINDFNTSTPQPVANTGKLFFYLNQTLFNYEWWTPRTNYSTVPAKSVVLIDLGSVSVVPDSGQDRSDYNTYKDQLRYRHRDVRYLSVATNQELFKDILRDENDKETPGTVGSSNLQLGANLAKKICENPATFQYNACRERKSDNIQYVGYVTPGYKQNWAMYPEFFLKSFNIKFTFKADDGDIKVCYDRQFPPERQDEYYCKELKLGEEKVFDISNPCKGRSFDSCEPFYFTVWGKDRTTTTPCLDERCASLDQIKFTVTHSGVQCSSSNHLLPSTTFQVIAFFITAILYLFLNNNKS